MKSDKMPYIIYADLESLIKKSSTAKIGEYIYNANNLTFSNIESKQILNRGEDCMKKFCESLRKH